MGKRDVNSWHGIEDSCLDSLMNHRFIMRFVPSEKQYKVLARIDGRFYYQEFDAEKWIQDLKDNLGTTKFPCMHDLRCLGSDERELMNEYEENHCQLLNDLIEFYGIDEIFEFTGEGLLMSDLMKNMYRVLR